MHERSAKSPDGRRAERHPAAPGTLSQRLFWFGALWLCGVATVSLVALAIRTAIVP